jgi:hypothetical protein
VNAHVAVNSTRFVVGLLHKDALDEVKVKGSDPRRDKDFRSLLGVFKIDQSKKTAEIEEWIFKVSNFRFTGCSIRLKTSLWMTT